MRAARQLTAAGIAVSVVENDKLKLSGLDCLSQKEADRLIDYARRNKTRLLRELKEEARSKLLADFALEIRFGMLIDLLTGVIVGEVGELEQVVTKLAGQASEESDEH